MLRSWIPRGRGTLEHLSPVSQWTGEQEPGGGQGRLQKLSWKTWLDTKPTWQTSLRVDTEFVGYKYSSQGQSAQDFPDTIGRIISNLETRADVIKGGREEMTQIAHSPEKALEDVAGSFRL